MMIYITIVHNNNQLGHMVFVETVEFIYYVLRVDLQRIWKSMQIVWRIEERLLPIEMLELLPHFNDHLLLH